MNKFAERLKELRLEKGMSQAELAKKLDVTRPAITYWESRHRDPSLTAAMAVAQYFGVSLDYLSGLED